MTIQVQSFPLSGGLNVADEQIRLKPGEMTDCLNVDVGIAGGYYRSDGYERTDGRAETPSLAAYRYMTFTSGGPRAVNYGDMIVGVVSGATAKLCGQAELTSGAWVNFDASGTIGIAQKTGTFVSGETVQIGGVNAFIINAVDDAATLDDARRLEYIAGAANLQRALINIVPGSGPVRCVFVLKGALYAIRDNVGSTAGIIYRANGSSGWTAQPFNKLLGFGTGSSFITEGATINGQTSGATATVARTALRSGDWTMNTAAGVLSLTNIVGTFQMGENIRIGATVCAVVNALATTPTLAAGGNYEVALWNFYGSYDTMRAYLVNGVGQGFEFSDGVYVPIATGMPDDKPEHIAIHKNYVFMSFKGSVQNSGVGEPHAWTARLGANEIGAGDQVSCLHSIRNDVLGIITLNTTQLLYGSNGTDWELKKMSEVMGGYARCMIDVPGSSVVLDSNGVQTITATKDFGDFEGASLSRKINSLLRVLTNPVCMAINRIKSQIRIFYADGSMISGVYAGDKIIGWSKHKHAHTFSFVWNGEDAGGAEVTVAAGADGYVYQLDSGNSFDGQKIESFIRLAFHHYGSPERRKRWRKIMLEMSGRDDVPIQYATEYDYGDPQYLAFSPTPDGANAGYYDFDTFGQFVYDGGVLTKLAGDIDGVSTNLSIILSCESDVIGRWSVEAAHVHYSPLGLLR
ncbi:MAG: hypothetical protein E6R03_07380 [Hyphomicrobiaceae bacterium]|nr:MAG: hypothetical protein E6R03_07380 [Hyphomicrobiaceae bacterium]